MTEDRLLLHQFTSQGTRHALDELVRRHLDLVYSSALRQVRDPHLAEDITQAVFLILAQKAHKIRDGVALAGWLLAVTQTTAVDAMKRQITTRRHEAALAKPELVPPEAAPSAEWDQISPVLDSALNHLPPRDRDAIVLRVLENHSFAQVGAELGITQDAAKMRVSRGLLRLRKFLKGRGITTGVAALAASVSAHAVHAAPSHLIVATLATTAAGTASASIVALVKAAHLSMTWNRAKLAGALAFFVLIALSFVVLYMHTAALANPAAGPAFSPRAAIPAIYNLGTLGTASEANGVNASGQVVGIYRAPDQPADKNARAFLYTGTPGKGGAMFSLGMLPSGIQSWATGINASGQVSGYSVGAEIGTEFTFRYTGTPGAGGSMVSLGEGDGLAINDKGQVVGVGAGERGAFRLTRYTGTPDRGGVRAELGTLSGYSLGYGINDRGQVTGKSAAGASDHAFLYTDAPGGGGAMEDLGTLGGTYSIGTGINNDGKITGESSTAAGQRHAFVYSGMFGSGGMMMDLGTLGGTSSAGLAINTAGQIVGTSTTSAGTEHAFLYIGTPRSGGHMIDLDAWLHDANPTESAKWILNRATGITDNGLICGTGTYNDGPGGLNDGTRAFLLDASALTASPNRPR